MLSKQICLLVSMYLFSSAVIYCQSPKKANIAPVVLGKDGKVQGYTVDYRGQGKTVESGERSGLRT